MEQKKGGKESMSGEINTDGIIKENYTLIKDKKICIVGLGGVGGFLGGTLARQYPHVMFYARGDRKDALLKKGISIESEYIGNFTVRPEKISDKAEDFGIMDYIIISVKNYSLEQVCNQIAPMVGEKTVIIPIMNGTNPGERVRKYLGKGIVLDALIYIVSGSNEDYTITQKGKYASVHIGLNTPDIEEQKAIKDVHAIIQGAGVECVMEEDIQAVIWKKYVLNCAYNVLTAYYSATTGELRNDPKKVEEYKELLAEACLVGRTKGVSIPDNMEEEQLRHLLYIQTEDATSSLRRDMDAGRLNELDTFSGYLLEEGKKYGIGLPVTERFYRELKRR